MFASFEAMAEYYNPKAEPEASQEAASEAPTEPAEAPPLVVPAVEAPLARHQQKGAQGLNVLGTEDQFRCITCGKYVHKDLCCTWRKKDKPNKTYARCKVCNRGQKRVSDVAFGSGPEVKDRWKKMDAQSKAEFYAEHSARLAKDQATAFSNLVSEANSTSSSSGFYATGETYDESELDKLYSERPEQLAAIKKNATKVWHPVRETYLYTVDKFESKRAEEDRHEQKHDAQLQQQESNFRKAEKVPKSTVQVAKKVKKLTSAQKTKLSSIHTTAGEQVELGKKTWHKVQHSEGLGGFVPKAVLDGFLKCLEQLSAEVCAVKIPLEEDDWEGAFLEIKEPAEKALKEYEVSERRLSMFVEEYMSMHGKPSD